MLKKNKLLKIIDTFGVKNQLKKFNEECYEFIEAINDYREEETQDNLYHITEEMADVLVLLKQFQAKYKITNNQIDSFIDSKIDRTIKRIKENYYEQKRG